MEENMNLENEVMDQATEIAEYDEEGIGAKDVAVFGAGIAILSAAGYGVYTLGKKGWNWIKERKAIRDEAKRIVAERAEEEEFDPDEIEEEIHVVK